MATSPDLGIPLIANQQEQPEITHNEAVILLMLSFKGVITRGQNTPPGSPDPGDAYILGASPTGDWSGQANKIAVFYSAAWRFLPDVDDSGTNIPIGVRHEGLRVFVNDEDVIYVWSGIAWNPLSTDASGGGGGGTSLQRAVTGMKDSASGTAAAAKGARYTPQNSFVARGLVFWSDTVSGATYRALICELDGSNEIQSVEQADADVVAPASNTARALEFAFGSGVTMTAGTTYWLALVRTDGANSYVLPIWAATAEQEGQPDLGGLALPGAYIADTAPAVSDSLSTFGSTYVSFALILEG